MITDLIADALWGSVQLLAAYALKDEDREKHPELVERGLTREWASSMTRSLEDEHGPSFVRVVLDNPFEGNGHAGYCLSVRYMNGYGVRTLLRAQEDLRVMLWHYGDGEGPELPDEEDKAFGTSLLVRAGHGRRVAALVAEYCVVAISSARLRRMVKRSAAKESATYQNAKFRRGDAVLGVRPWVYDGRVDPNKDDEPDDVILALLDSLNYKEGDGVEGRWAAFKTAHHS